MLFPAVSPGPRTVSQHENTMAAKDGAGPRPAAHRAKRCFLKCLETIELQPLLFPAVSSGPRTVSQHQNTMAAKDGSGPRPAAHRAKRCFLNCLEARASTLAFSCRQLGSKDGVAAPKHHGSEGRIGPAAGSPSCQTLLSEVPRNLELQPLLFPAVSPGPRTVSQHQNTMAAKDGAGPRPAAHRAKRCFLKCLETRASTLAFSCRQLGSKDGVAAPKHHGSEGRSGPAAGSPSCQTLLSEVPRN